MKAHAVLSAKCDISFIRTWWPLTFDSNPSEETCLISQGVSCFPSRYHWSMYASALHVMLYVSCSFTCLCDLKIRDLISCIFLSHHATQVLEHIGFSLGLSKLIKVLPALGPPLQSSSYNERISEAVRCARRRHWQPKAKVQKIWHLSSHLWSVISSPEWPWASPCTSLSQHVSIFTVKGLD